MIVMDVDGADNQWPFDPDKAMDLANAPTARTPNGGKHHYFRLPNGKPWRNSASKLAPGVDTRTENGYVVCSPSEVNGNEYTWIVDLDCRLEGLSIPPAWLIADLDRAFAEPKSKNNPKTKAKTNSPDSLTKRVIAYLANCPPAIASEENEAGKKGHAQAFAVARAIVWGFNLPIEIALELLMEHYNPRCVPPWTEKELRHKCEEADTKPFDKPRGYLLAGITERKEWEALDDPGYMARCILDFYHHLERPKIAFFREQFWRWNGPAWCAVPDSEMRAEVNHFAKQHIDETFAAVLEDLQKQGDEEAIEKLKAPKVTTALVTNILEALSGDVVLAQDTPLSTWIGGNQNGA